MRHFLGQRRGSLVGTPRRCTLWTTMVLRIIVCGYRVVVHCPASLHHSVYIACMLTYGIAIVLLQDEIFLFRKATLTSHLHFLSYSFNECFRGLYSRTIFGGSTSSDSRSSDLHSFHRRLCTEIDDSFTKSFLYVSHTLVLSQFHILTIRHSFTEFRHGFGITITYHVDIPWFRRDSDRFHKIIAAAASIDVDDSV